MAITPAAGFVLPGPALAMGLGAGAVCFWTATTMKAAFGYDDSLDAFGVHGIGGIPGTLATGWFAFGPLSATKDAPAGAYVGGLSLMAVQVVGVAATIVYCAAASWVLLKITDMVVGLRVSREEEREGLDIVLHGEQVFRSRKAGCSTQGRSARNRRPCTVVSLDTTERRHRRNNCPC